MYSAQKLKLHYKVGDELDVKVIERVDNNAWIVSLRGMLIQVRNSTTFSLKEGDTVRMRLVSLNPPQLSWI
jgi:uncharacterized Fe-S cluster-containing radical SAM superfamily enzyme